MVYLTNTINLLLLTHFQCLFFYLYSEQVPMLFEVGRKRDGKDKENTRVKSLQEKKTISSPGGGLQPFELMF